MARYRKKDHAFPYWKKRTLDPEINAKKNREFLIDPAYNRPRIDPTLISYGVATVKNSLDIPLIERSILLVLHLEQYTFFTIRHIRNMNIEDAKFFPENVVKSLGSKDIIEPVVRPYDMTDAEYRQMFGEDTNRHNYRLRYALTPFGRRICDKFYESIKD